MDKQICFFATQKDIDFLICNLYALGAFVIDYAGNPLEKQALESIADYSYRQTHFGYSNFLITKPDFTLSYRTVLGKTEVDQYVSEVIEFSLCTPVPKRVLDTSSVDEEFRRGGVVVIDDSDKYNRLMKELMMNPKYVENPNYIVNGFEQGRLWYSPVFFNSNGEMFEKTRMVGLLFNDLKKTLKKNFRLSKDKFAYIAPDAYANYLLGSFVPCSGKNRIVF